MSNLTKLVPALLFVGLNLAHAQKAATVVCDARLAFPPIDGSRALTPVKTDRALEQIAVNTPIEIIKEDNSKMLGPDRDKKQEELAIKGGQLLAQEILKIQGLAEEQATVDAAVIISRAGAIPQEALDSFGDILNASVAKLEGKDNKEAEFDKQTSNALGELTRVVTQYRKNAFDVNGIAKILFFLKLRKQSDYVRNNFQSVKEAAKAIDDTLETSLALMFKRHYQMLDARVQLKTLERYAELSGMMVAEAQRLLEEYADQQNFDDVQKSAFIKNAVKPLSDRSIQLIENRAVVSLSYAQFTLLMDGNLSLISMISNIRETANLQITVFGAAKIILQDMKDVENQGNAAKEAFALMRAQTVEEIKKFGIRQRQVPDRQIKSIEQMVTQIDQLENEIAVGRDFQVTTIKKFKEGIATLQPKLDAIAARAAAGFPPQGSLIKIADEELKKANVQEPKQFDRMPKVPALEAPAAN